MLWHRTIRRGETEARREQSLFLENVCFTEKYSVRLFGKYRTQTLSSLPLGFPAFPVLQRTSRIQKNLNSPCFFPPICAHIVLHQKICFCSSFFHFFSSSLPPMDSVRIQSLNPGEATCVGHPWCPGIWPQWYEEARCSWKQNRQHSCQVLFVTPEQRLNDAKNQSMAYRLVRLGPCKQNKLNRFNYSQWKVIQTTAAWADLKSLFVKEESLKFYYWSYVQGFYIDWGKKLYLLFLFFDFWKKQFNT